MWVAFANAKASHIFFSKNISVYAICNDQSFNNMLTNDIVSFEQLGPGVFEPVTLWSKVGRTNSSTTWMLQKKIKMG